MPSEKYSRVCKRPAIVASVSLALGLKEFEGDSVGTIAQVAMLLVALALVIAAATHLIEAIGPLFNKRSNDQAERHTGKCQQYNRPR